MGIHAAVITVLNCPGFTGYADGDLKVTDFNVNNVNVEDIDFTHQGTYDGGDPDDVATFRPNDRVFEPAKLWNGGTITLSILWTGEEEPVVGGQSSAFSLGAGGRKLISSTRAYLRSISNVRGELGREIRCDLEIQLCEGTTMAAT